MGRLAWQCEGKVCVYTFAMAEKSRKGGRGKEIARLPENGLIQMA
jgi:hypothetical protein